MVENRPANPDETAAAINVLADQLSCSGVSWLIKEITDTVSRRIAAISLERADDHRAVLPTDRDLLVDYIHETRKALEDFCWNTGYASGGLKLALSKAKAKFDNELAKRNVTDE